MRLALVITGLGMGGAERQVVDLADQFVQRGVEVLIVYLTGAALTTPTDARVQVEGLQMTKSPLGILKAALHLRSILRGFRPDVVHSHMVHANLLLRVLRLTMRIPYLVCTAHSTNEGGRLRMVAYRLTDRLASINTNVSQEAVDAFIRSRAVSAERMQAIPNGIDCERFAPDLSSRRRLRRQQGVQSAEKVILAVGRLVDAKDYPNLLESFSKILTRFPHSMLWIVGAGGLLPELEALAYRLGVKRRVTFLGVRLDVAAVMNAADIFVLSSTWEGFGLVVGEAMCCEKVVVATDCGGVADLLGPCGILVPPRNSRALAAALSHALKLEDAEVRDLGARARRRVQERFSIEAAVDRWLEVYGSGPSAADNG